MTESVEHAAFGTVAFNASLGDWRASLPVEDETGTLAVEAETPEDAVRQLDARAGRVVGLVTAARVHAANGLTTLKNDAWLEDDEVPLTVEVFQARLTFETLSVSEAGHTVWFDDGDLFWGHVVCVVYDATGAFVSAGIAG